MFYTSINTHTHLHTNTYVNGIYSAIKKNEISSLAIA